MPIYDDNPQNKVVTVEFVDTGAANFEFTRAYIYDECGDFKGFNDIDIDGNPYTPVGPIQKANSGTTVLDVTGIETVTTLTQGVNSFTYTNEDGIATTVDLSVYIDDTNLARLVSGTLAPSGIATFTRDDSTTFTLDLSPLFDDTNLSRITSGNITGSNLILTRDDSTTLSIDISGLATQAALTTHINDTNNPHNTNLLNLTDVTSTTYTPNANYVLQANAAGTSVELVRVYEQVASREDALLHQQNTFFVYLTLTANIPEDGEYMLFGSQRFSLNTTTSNFESHVEYNGDFFLINHIEFKDAAGPGQVVPNTTGGSTSTGTDNFQTRTGMKKFTLTAGTHVFNLEYRGQNINQEATMYEAELYIKRILG